MTKLQDAIALLRAGDRQAGKQLLAEVLAEDPRSETAWLWMSSAVDQDEQRAYCLRQILKINPAHPGARAGLAQLEGTQAAPAAAQQASSGSRAGTWEPEPEPWSGEPAAEEPIDRAAWKPAAAQAGSFDGQMEPAAPPSDPIADQERERTDFVVRQLSKHVGLNDIVYVLCETTGMPWAEAEAFVRDVEEANRTKIARRQSPILLLVGAIILLTGFLLAYNSASYLAAVASSLGESSSQNVALYILDAPYLVRRVIMLAVGMAMIVGGLIGTVKAILPPSETLISDGHVEGSIDDVVGVGVYVGGSGGHDRRRRGTRIL